jgi:Tfp pilus assembly protein PilX
MKPAISSLDRRRGSVLMIGLIVGAILCLSLLGYLALVHQQNLAVARSQAWNAALALAEAGAEEALAQLNAAVGRTNSLGGSAWSLNGGYYRPDGGERTLIGGTYDVLYTPVIPPTIYSTGYAALPIKSTRIGRAIEVKTTNAPLYSAAIVARYNINMNGNNVTTDSYDSRSPIYSENGLYKPSMIRSNGDIASAQGTINVGNANIKGRAGTSPTGTISVGPGGYVTGGTFNDFNMEFPDVPPPYQSGFAVPNGNNPTLTGGNYYVAGNYSLGNNGEMLVTAPTTLYVTGNFTMNANAAITIRSNASLTLYVGGPSTTFGQVNTTAPTTAAAFQYYGLPSNTSVSIAGGNGMFVGVIYAPRADFSATGGGNNILDMQGAMVVRSLTMGGHFNMHFDEALRAAPIYRGYVAISWREL